MNPFQHIHSPHLLDAGLNCHAVFELSQLAPMVREKILQDCPQAAAFKQILLFGQGGSHLWQALSAQQGMPVPEPDSHPIDDWSVAAVRRYLEQDWPDCAYELVYPGPVSIGLQSLGQLAGWHHASPFMVGVNAYWGSWFAYRCLVLANTDLPVTVSADAPTSVQGEAMAACPTCAERVCISACPAKALEGGEFKLNACLDYRRQSDSLCQTTCSAREACPVGSEHRYSRAQLAYHYGRSFAMLKQIKET